MKFKYVLIISLLLCVALSLSAVSAADTDVVVTDLNETSTVAIDAVDSDVNDSNNLDFKTVELNEDDSNGGSGVANGNTVTLTNGTFADIQAEIDSATSGVLKTIILEGTFTGNGTQIILNNEKHKDTIYNIKITSTNGAILDAKNKSGIFYFRGYGSMVVQTLKPTVTLENLTLVNSYSDKDKEAVIFNEAANLTIKGNFYIENSTTMKGTICNVNGASKYFGPSFLTIEGSLHINNCNTTASVCGVAIYSENYHNVTSLVVTGSLYITNCNCINSDISDSSIICIKRQNYNTYDLIFNVTGYLCIENCGCDDSRIRYGIYNYGGILNLANCEFKNISIYYEGSVISTSVGLNIKNSTFINNTYGDITGLDLLDHGNSIHVQGTTKNKTSIINCTFNSPVKRAEILLLGSNVTFANNTFNMLEGYAPIKVSNDSSVLKNLLIISHCTLEVLNNRTVETTEKLMNFTVFVYDDNNNIILFEQLLRLNATNPHNGEYTDSLYTKHFTYNCSFCDNDWNPSANVPFYVNFVSCDNDKIFTNRTCNGCTVIIVPDTSFAALRLQIDDAIAKNYTLVLNNDTYYCNKYCENKTCEHNASDITYKNGINITGNLVINGNGKTINGDNVYRIFNIINGANVTIYNLTFINTNGSAFTCGSIFLINGSLNVTQSIFISQGNLKRAICSYDNLTVNDCIFDNNGTQEALIYIERGTYNLDGNYWCKNYANKTEFENSLLIEAPLSNGGGDGSAPNNWILMDITTTSDKILKGRSTNFTVNLNTLTDGVSNSTYTGSLPDYTVNVNVNGTDGVVISNLAGNFSYTPSEFGEFDLVATNTISNNELCRNTFEATYPDDSYCALQKAINDAIDSGAESLDLNIDYLYYEEFDTDYKNGVVINGTLTINGNGNGKTINGNRTARAFNITSDSIVTINNLNFTNCSAIYEDIEDDKYGGAIYNWGNLTVSGSNFTGCNASQGGAIYNGGILTVSGSSFTGCNATYGGAIFNYDNDGLVLSIITGSIFTNCSCSGDGGAIDNGGNLSVSDCEFVGCNASNGGAIFNEGFNLTVSGSSFTGCNATYGGAVYSIRDISVKDCIFDNNVKNNGVIYIGSENDMNFDGNYWCGNYNTVEEFKDACLIKDSNGNVAPNNWILMNIINSNKVCVDKNASFNVTLNTLTNGVSNTTYTGSLPDYCVVISDDSESNANAVVGDAVVITDGVGTFNYTPSSVGNFTLTAESAYTNAELLQATFFADGLTVTVNVEDIIYGEEFTSYGATVMNTSNDTIAADVTYKLYDADDNEIPKSAWNNLAVGNYTLVATAVDTTGVYATASGSKSFYVVNSDSFSALQILVNRAIADEDDLTLTYDYKYYDYDPVDGIVINGALTIYGYNHDITCDVDSVVIFAINDDVSVVIEGVDFVNTGNDGIDIKVNNAGATLNVTGCTSDNLKSIYLVSGTVNDMNATVNDNSTIYAGVNNDFELNATVTANDLKVYIPNFKFTVGNAEFSALYDDEGLYYNYQASLNTAGTYAAGISGVDDVSTGTVIVLDSSSISVSSAECNRGDKVNITVSLNCAVPNDYKVVLYVDSVAKGTVSFAAFTNISGKYYYNFTVETAGITDDSVPLWAEVLDANGDLFVASDKDAFLTLTSVNPEISAISVSGNYSTKVNITVTVTAGNVTGDKIVLHLIDGENVTATVNETGVAVFENVLLSKAGNYETEIVYTRLYSDSSEYYSLAKAPVTWDISKITTNVTFTPVDVTGNVNDTCGVIVTVIDYYDHNVTSGQINVTGTGIQLVDGNGNPYNGTVYNLTNGSVTVYFKYLKEGVYTPNFNYTNINSTYSNTNNYFYSNANLTVNITKANVTVNVYESSRNVSGRVYDNITINGNVTGGLVTPVGNVTINVNGTDYNATVGADGSFNIVVNASSAYTGIGISVKFISGNTTMWEDTSSTSPNLVNITINPINTTVNVVPVAYNKTAGDAFNITGTVTAVNSTTIPTGEVAIVINGTTYKANVTADGSFSIPVTINNAGTWNNLNVTFTCNQTKVWYSSVSDNVVNVTINKLNTTIKITDDSAEYVVNVNGTFDINGNVTAANGEMAEGNVTITVNGQNFTANVTNGVFSIKNINSSVGLDKAAYNITFLSNNTNRWADCIGVDIVNITVNKLNTTINITTDKIIVVVINQTYYINGTVTDDVYHNGVAGNVTVTIGSETLTVATDANGKFSISNSTDNYFGPLNCTVSFSDFNESVYNAPANESVNITVNRLNTTINIISVVPESAYVDQYIIITGNVTDDYYHKGVYHCKVTITVNGIDYTNYTDKNGSFVLNITSSKALAKADYNVTGGFDIMSAYYYAPKSVNVSLEFKKLPTNVTVDNVTYTGKVNSTITITGTVNDTIYNKAANGTVFLTLNGKEFNTTVDPTTGKFSLDVSCNVSGTYKKLTVRYVTSDNDVWENSTSSKITITVEALNVYIISNYDLASAYNASFNRARAYTFNVTDEMGNKVQNGTLKLYLRNGTLTKDVSNGQATFENVLFNDTGLYGFMLDYIGNQFYLSTFNATTINVTKVATTIYINGSIKDNSKVLNITVKDNIDNKAVIKGTIYYVTPDGQEHKITLTNGSAIVNITANRTGEYDIAVSYYDIEQDYLYSTEDFKYNITVAGIENKFQSIIDPANGELIDNKLLITSTVRDDNGNIIEDGVMNYYIGGNQYSANVVNGVANLEVDGFTGPLMVITQFTGEDCTQPKEIYVVEPSSYNVNANLVSVLA